MQTQSSPRLAVARKTGGADKKPSSYNLVQAVDRAVSILEALAVAPGGLTIAELCEKLDMHKTTVFRILNTLSYRGYVEEDLRTAVYRLNLRVFSLAQEVLKRRNVEQESRPFIEELRRKAKGGDIHLISVNGHDLTVGPVVGGSEGLLTHLGPRREGRKGAASSPVVAAAIQKLLLAHLPEKERTRLLKDETFPALAGLLTEGVTSVDSALTLLQMIERQGFLIDDWDEVEPVRYVVAPIWNYLSHIVAVISVSAPAETLPMTRALEFGKLVKKTAAAISERLGYRKTGE